jgi:hypothetical protein
MSELSAEEQLDEWNALTLSEKMRSEIAMASAYADEVAALEARIVDLEFAEKELKRDLLKANARRERLERELHIVLDVAVARGQRLGYEDDDYHIRLTELEALAVEEEA